MRELHGLELLAAIVEAKSFVRAGERLGLSQSGTSRAVARLEEQVGVRLFDRSARGVALTDEGRRFHAQVAPLLAGLQDALADVGGTAVRGRLRVNVDAFVARNVLAGRVGEWLRAHPELQLELLVRPELGNLVLDGFDAALRFGEPQRAGLVTRRVMRTRIVCVASPTYLARHGRPRAPADLARHACILYIDPDTRRPFEWELHRGGKVIKADVGGTLTLNDPDTALAVCLAGDGIGQMMELAVRPYLERGELVELLPRWAEEQWPLHLYLPSRHLPPAKVRAFADWVVALSKR